MIIKKILLSIFGVSWLFFALYLLFVNLFLGILLLIAHFIAGPFFFVAVFTDKTGEWNPSSKYQRYRGDSYSKKKPFFQWWYFSLKDYESDLTFAFCYSLSRPAKDKRNTGAYTLFAKVDTHNKCHIYYKYPLQNFKVENHFDLDIGNSLFTITVISNDHYKIKGEMNNRDNVWVAEGISADAVISWDLDVYRVAGWYGQKDLEWMQRLWGMISWNTYAYNSEVEGTVTVDDKVYTFSRGERFRMYCDMNWGEAFPSTRSSKKEQIDYPWGWYYTGSPQKDNVKDFSIIAGAGRTQPTKGFANDMYARFASIYWRGEKIDARLCKVFDIQPDKGISFFHPSSDKTCKEFKIERLNWVEFKDGFGRAIIPLTQIISIETASNKIIMTFESNENNYNRLLFPTDGYIFSDFEGLGVLCTTEFYKKDKDDFVLKEKIIDKNAGLEYGYRIDDDFDYQPFIETNNTFKSQLII